MHKYVIPMLIAFMAVVMAGDVFAHGGGLDRNGCHVDHRTGVKHCHR